MHTNPKLINKREKRSMGKNIAQIVLPQKQTILFRIILGVNIKKKKKKDWVSCLSPR